MNSQAERRAAPKPGCIPAGDRPALTPVLGST